MEIETKNAKITGTMLGVEDHGILSFMLYLDYGGSGQGAGGYCLDTPTKKPDGSFNRRVGTAAGMELIARILRVVGVEKWEDLPGQVIRVQATQNKIRAIGHFLKDEPKNWLNFEEFFRGVKEDPALNGDFR